MVRYIDIHPVDPQQRTVEQAVALLRGGGLIAYPTDSGYALGAQIGNADALERIRSIRQLDDKHHFTLVVDEFAALGPYVHMDNWVFRLVKANTPGRYTFILPATREVPRKMQHPKKRSVGVRIPDHRTTLELLRALGEPMLSSTLLLPGEEDPPIDGWSIKQLLEYEVDAVIDSGDCGIDPTTVVDLTGDEPVIARHGAGDPTPFE